MGPQMGKYFPILVTIDDPITVWSTIVVTNTIHSAMCCQQINSVHKLPLLAFSKSN